MGKSSQIARQEDKMNRKIDILINVHQAKLARLQVELASALAAAQAAGAAAATSSSPLAARVENAVLAPATAPARVGSRRSLRSSTIGKLPTAESSKQTKTTAPAPKKASAAKTRELESASEDDNDGFVKPAAPVKRM